MTHGSLFSGIGGFDLAAQWMGWKNIFHCEIAEIPRKILKYHFPESISYHDITKTDFSVHRGTIDVISGGFPCQPFSLAGNRLGSDDSRYLWKEMLRAIREIQPKWVVGENVLGFTNWSQGLVFEQVQADLEAEGYEVQSYLLCAAGINAPHLRYRVFIVAHAKHDRNCGISGGLSSPTERKDKDRQEQSSCWKQIQFSDKSDSLFGITSDSAGNGCAYGCAETGESERCSQEGGVQQSERVGNQWTASDPDQSSAKHEIQSRRDLLASKDAYITSYSDGKRYTSCREGEKIKGVGSKDNQEQKEWPKPTQRFDRLDGLQWDSAHSDGIGLRTQGNRIGNSDVIDKVGKDRDWGNFPVEPPLCGGNDGISTRLDSITFSKWRQESIKGYGNAVVPQLVYRIFDTIQQYENL